MVIVVTEWADRLPGPPTVSSSTGAVDERRQLALISSQAESQSLYATHFTFVRPSRHLVVGVTQYESCS